MHPQAYARRHALAWRSIAEQVDALAHKAGVELDSTERADLLNPQGSTEMQTLKRAEVTAKLLELIIPVVPGPAPKKEPKFLGKQKPIKTEVETAEGEAPEPESE